MGRQLTNFEESIKSAAGDLELPYDPSMWDQLETQLDAASKANSTNFMSVLLAAAGVAAIISSALFVTLSNAGSEGTIAERTIKIEKNTKYQAIAEKGDLTALEESHQSSTSDSETLDLAEGGLIDGGTDQATNADDATTSNILSENPTDDSATNTADQTSDATQDDTAENGANILDGEKVDLSSLRPDEVAFGSSIREGCEGIEVVFDLMTEEIDGSYLWNFGDGHFSSAQKPKHVYSKSGTYTISLSITSRTDGLIRSKTVEDMIVINPKPEADFEYEFIHQVTNVPTVKFTNKSDEAQECEWSFGNGEASTEINPEMQYVQEGKHSVKLTAVNEFGCSDVKYKYISIDDDYELLAPESFAPGKATGAKYFMPEALKLNNFDFKLTIYDEMQPIFESTSKRKGWNGMMPDSTLAKSGDYPWVVIIYNNKGEEEQYYSGTITITP